MRSACAAKEIPFVACSSVDTRMYRAASIPVFLTKIILDRSSICKQFLDFSITFVKDGSRGEAEESSCCGSGSDGGEEGGPGPGQKAFGGGAQENCILCGESQMGPPKESFGLGKCAVCESEAGSGRRPRGGSLQHSRFSRTELAISFGRKSPI